MGRLARLSALALVAMLGTGASVADDTAAAESLVDLLADPSPVRRVAAYRTLQRRASPATFRVLLAHRDDRRPAVRRRVTELLRGVLRRGPDEYRRPLLEALWDTPRTALGLVPDLERLHAGFAHETALFARAIAMRARGTREHVVLLASSPVGRRVLERFDPERAPTLLALTHALSSRREPPLDSPVVVPWREILPHTIGALRGELARVRALCADADPGFPAELARRVHGSSPFALPLWVRIAATRAALVDASAAALAAHVSGGGDRERRAIANALFAGDGASPATWARIAAAAGAALEAAGDGIPAAERVALVVLAARDPGDTTSALLEREAARPGAAGLAARLLRAEGPDAAERIAREAWRDAPGTRARLRLVHALTKVGVTEFRPFFSLALRESPTAREFVRYELERMPDRLGVLPPLLAGAGEADREERAALLRAAAGLDPELRLAATRRALVEALASDREETRTAALQACAALRRFPPEVADAITRAAGERAAAPPGELARLVVGAGHAGPRGRPLVPLLAELVRSARDGAHANGVRRDALRALAHVAPEAPAARAAFLEGLQDPERITRATAAYCFRSIGTLRAAEREALEAVARTDPWPQARVVATATLDRRRTPAPAAYEGPVDGEPPRPPR